MSAKETAEAILIVIKRIGKWLFIGVSIVLLLIASFIGYEKFSNYLDNRPTVHSELKGIKIGEKYSDFAFRNPGFVQIKEKPKKSIGETYYENESLSLSVSVEKNYIVDVTYICQDKFEMTSLNGVACQDSGDNIFEKYGNEVRVQCLIDKSDKMATSYRVYDVVKYGVRHHVISNKVIGFQIVNPEKLSTYVGINFTKCE